jgi:small-conductance mechanosensitive channel
MLAREVATVIRAARLFLAGFLALAPVAGAGVRAQQPAPPATPPAEEAPGAYDATEVPEQAERMRDVLREVEKRARTTSALDELVARVDEARRSLPPRVARAQREILEGPPLRRLLDVKAEWQTESARAERAATALTARARQLDVDLQLVQTLEERWRATVDAAVAAEAPPDLVERIRAAVAEIGRVREVLRGARAQALTSLSRVARQEGQIDQVLVGVSEQEAAWRDRLFERDEPLHRALLAGEDETPFLAGVRRELAAATQRSADYTRANVERMLLHGLLLAIALASLLLLRRRVAGLAAEDESFSPALRVFARPYSAALLLGLLVIRWVHPDAPLSSLRMVQVLGLFAGLRVLLSVLGAGFRPVATALVTLFLLDQFGGLLTGLPVLARLLGTITASFGALFVVWLHRSEIPGQIAAQLHWRRPVAWLLRGSGLLFAVSAAADLIGFATLASVLVDGTVVVLLAATLLFGSVRVLDGLLRVGVRVLPDAAPRIVRRHVAEIERWGRTAVRFGALGYWAWLVLGRFQIREPLLDGVVSVVSTKVPFGDVSLSLGDLLAFGIAVAASFAISGLLRTVLEDEVFPRVEMRRGVPNAISRSLHYAVLVLGFLLAIAAAGVDLDKFAIVAGAFGVGIGFGLQNVVNNFVSGLILLFERPVQLGDTIQVGSMTGEVKRIGVRSSTIRAPEGAEVILPNASLISEQVVNWTLSDRQRRIDVRVGVAYGTDPERVIALLLGVAAANSLVLKDPEPMALFLGFGDSALDFELRCWIDQFDRFPRVRSEICLEINRVLAEAGIEIPFPQRDLHLRSVGESAVRALRAGDGRDA